MSQYRCSGTTASGSECRNFVPTEGGTCSWHTPLEGESTCSVCMEMMTSRNFRELPCGHRFHTKCLRKWKAEGNRTCPLCREEFDAPQFRVTVNVEPLGEASNSFVEGSFDASRFAPNLVELDIISSTGMFNTELTFEAEDLGNLRSVLQRIGIDLDHADLDTLIRRDTE